MLTVDPDRLVDDGDRVLDVGCGEGRHSHAASLVEAVEPAAVVGLDLDRERLLAARDRFDETFGGGDGVAPDEDDASRADDAAPDDETGPDDDATRRPTFVRGDAYRLPFPDGAFDVVICSEVLEHLPEYRQAVDELDRVLSPGGDLAVSVPRYGPERLCWALSEEYHQVEGGHVRIFDPAELRQAIEDEGLSLVADGYAHAFHAPYWWLKCLWWDRAEAGDPPAPLRFYERFLEWAEFEAPAPVGAVERGLDRLFGKSVVLYFEKP